MAKRRLRFSYHAIDSRECCKIGRDCAHGSLGIPAARSPRSIERRRATGTNPAAGTFGGEFVGWLVHPSPRLAAATGDLVTKSEIHG